MSERDREPFLARWSRRKLDAPAEPASPASAPSAAAEPRPQPTEPATLPALDSLDGLNSDYREFMRSGVDDGIRRDALKKLFTDPHFNKMDGLDTYIEDYSIESPIPEAMLRGLSQARSLFLFEEKEDAKAGEQPETASPPAPPLAAPAALTDAASEDADVRPADPVGDIPLPEQRKD